MINFIIIVTLSTRFNLLLWNLKSNKAEDHENHSRDHNSTNENPVCLLCLIWVPLWLLSKPSAGQVCQIPWQYVTCQFSREEWQLHNIYVTESLKVFFSLNFILQLILFSGMWVILLFILVTLLFPLTPWLKCVVVLIIFLVPNSCCVGVITPISFL